MRAGSGGLRLKLRCFFEALRDVVPIDDVPPRFNVRSTLVLILEIVRVLPHVDHQNWDRSEMSLVLVVHRREHLQMPVHGMPCENSPPVTLDGGGGLRKMVLNLSKLPKSFVI